MNANCTTSMVDRRIYMKRFIPPPTKFSNDFKIGGNRHEQNILPNIQKRYSQIVAGFGHEKKIILSKMFDPPRVRCLRARVFVYVLHSTRRTVVTTTVTTTITYDCMGL